MGPRLSLFYCSIHFVGFGLAETLVCAPQRSSNWRVAGAGVAIEQDARGAMPAVAWQARRCLKVSPGGVSPRFRREWNNSCFVGKNTKNKNTPEILVDVSLVFLEGPLYIFRSVLKVI